MVPALHGVHYIAICFLFKHVNTASGKVKSSKIIYICGFSDVEWPNVKIQRKPMLEGVKIVSR